MGYNSQKCVCQDCKVRDAEYINSDEGLALCEKCYNDFQEWKKPLEDEIDDTAAWHNEFIKEKGNWAQRHKSWVPKMLDELLAAS